MTTKKTRKLSDSMRETLKALEGFDGGIDEGSTFGEVIASGGTKSTFYSAIEKGWAAKCRDAKAQGFMSTEMGNVPRYTLTEAGKQALAVDRWMED